MSAVDQESLPWHRLDPRMLLVHPVTEGARIIFPVLGVVILGTGRLEPWHLLAVVIPVALGVWRYLTTEFRITPEHLELRQGLLSRQVTRARLDKVRTVTLESGVVHRLLRLSKVEIGTGDDTRLELNALHTDRARGLRTDLLHRQDTLPSAIPAAPSDAVDDEVLLRFRPGWLVYAPFTGTGLAIAGATLAAVSGPLGDRIDDVVADLDHRFEGVPIIGLVLGGILLICVVLVVLSVFGYALTNWGFTFSRDRAGRSWLVRRGLLSTSESSVDVERVRGVCLRRPPALRLVGGAQLSALVTGVKEDAKTSAALAPASPYAVDRELAVRVTGDRAAVESGLIGHGPPARRRQVFRAVRLLGVIALAVSLLLGLGLDAPAWLVVLPWLLVLPGLPIGLERARGLGHLLTPQHLVVSAPSLGRQRTLLLRNGVISWRLQQSLFQRRLHLTTLVATSAAGSKAHEAVDVDLAVATRLAHEAVPGLVSQFLVES